MVFSCDFGLGNAGCWLIPPLLVAVSIVDERFLGFGILILLFANHL